MKEIDLTLADGRTLHAYDTGPDPDTDTGAETVVYWHHGTPNIGSPPEPLFTPGVRWISHDRPRYGASTALPDRDVASVAADTAAVADAFGVDRFAVLGHSSGGAHALACAALLPSRVTAAAGIAGLAPIDADGLDWFAGFGPVTEAALRAAVAGRTERAEVAGGKPDFTPEDWDALDGPWSWFVSVVGPAVTPGPDAAIDDDLATTRPWGFDPATITVPTLLVHGEADVMVPASHSRWLAGAIPGAELRLVPGDGHLSILRAGAAAVAWLSRS